MTQICFSQVKCIYVIKYFLVMLWIGCRDKKWPQGVSVALNKPESGTRSLKEYIVSLSGFSLISDGFWCFLQRQNAKASEDLPLPPCRSKHDPGSRRETRLPVGWCQLFWLAGLAESGRKEPVETCLIWRQLRCSGPPPWPTAPLLERLLSPYIRLPMSCQSCTVITVILLKSLE